MTQTQISRPAPALTYHLAHRPDTLEGLMNGTTAALPQEFGLSLSLPEDHPLYTDGDSRHHDLHVPVEVLRRSALFVAHRYFRVPAERPVVFAATEIEAAPVDAWRRGAGAGPAHLELDLVLEPADVVGGVPRGLECRAALRIDGADSGSAAARLVFLMPKVYQNHRRRGRALSSADGETSGSASSAAFLTGVPAPVEAGRVGRADPANVVVGDCEEGPNDTLVLQVAAEPGHPVYAEGAPDHVPSVVLLEASRQTSLLHAATLGGFSPADSVLTRWSASFQGFAEPDLPLTCTSTGGCATRDAQGRPVREFVLHFAQGARRIGVIRTSVLQLC
ncbi:AfsA-related hotdog domain-containing protein [Streptacidiphilus rugosus]|uniref:AfsA-related hotdog domain-containing protein n=1 Tax=Streptacidiphilus rugosus TaxID=405783 RepID=UPI0006920EB2|nr:AfsA-related hotdog domain-containing protein [Streptacidiphilus rugosus]